MEPQQCWHLLALVAYRLKPVKVLGPCKRMQHCWLTTHNNIATCCVRLHEPFFVGCFWPTMLRENFRILLEQTLVTFGVSLSFDLKSLTELKNFKKNLKTYFFKVVY